jgi:transcriptional regulator with XRE-family HTH domain
MATRSDLAFVARSIGARIRELRQAQVPVMSQERLARLADVSVGTIYRAEAGRAIPEWDTLDAIAKALGVGLSDLLVFEGHSRVILSGETLVA